MHTFHMDKLSHKNKLNTAIALIKKIPIVPNIILRSVLGWKSGHFTIPHHLSDSHLNRLGGNWLNK
jgi:hypothetical protein